MSFAYPASQNNGKIQSQTNSATAETITYQYDALNRLISAVTTDNPSVPQWGQQFVYDGFGTLTGKNVIKGSAPAWGGTGVYSDANGNQLTDAAGANTLQYDVENRLMWGQKGYSSPGVSLGYDPDNRRVYKSLWSYDMTNGWSLTGEEITYYGVTGQRMGAYTLQATPQTQYSPASLTLTTAVTNVYFGTKLIARSPNNDGSGRTIVSQDRLGSVGQYYPYGEQKGTATPDNTDKFATYYRDGELGFDYAMNRYYDPVRGRFLTPDPYVASAGPGNPGSWNRYAYVGGDPINRFDSKGLYEEDPDGGCWWCFPILPPIIIGGGGSFVPVLKPDPNWQANGQVLKNVAAWDVLIAAALVANQTRQQDEPGFRYVAYLNVVDDCFVKQVGGGSAVRRRRYQAIDNFGNPYASSSLTISEHNYVQTGSLSAYYSTWHVTQNGMFDDFLSRGSGPDTVEYQQFTASNLSGLNSFINQPVMVRDVANPNGPFFGTLGITLRQHDVFINGSDGKLNGNPKYCNTPDL